MDKPQKPVSFGDNVRILVSDETKAKGIAGLSGEVRGETTPSVTHVAVIGSCESDFAVNVFLPQLNEAFWLSPSLVEFVDHAPGTEIQLEGVKKKWIRSENGEWTEQTTEKPWWKFW